MAVRSLGCKLLCCVAILAAAAIRVSAQASAPPHSVSVPLIIRQDLPLASISVANAKRPLTFLVDTGSEITTLDKEVARELRLPIADDVEIQTVSADDTGTSADLPWLQLGGKRVRGLKVAVYDLSSVSQSLGVPVEGVLGIDVLRNFVFTIHYSRKEIVLADPANIHPPASAVSIRFGEGGCLIPISLNGNAPIEFLLDTGTNMTQLPAPVWSELTRAWKPSKIAAGLASNGMQAKESFAVKLRSARLGAYSVAGPVVRVWPQTSTGTFAANDAPALLASDFLQRFVLTVDLPQRKLWLHPDSSYRADPYEFSGIGLQFAAQKNNIYVVSVWDDSPAAHAGLLRGDQILKVQGKDVSQIGRKEISRMLHGPEGSVVSLLIRRGERVFAVPLRREALL